MLQSQINTNQVSMNQSATYQIERQSQSNSLLQNNCNYPNNLCKLRLHAKDFNGDIKLDKIHDILQKIHIYSIEETYQAITTCQIRIKEINEFLDAINQKKIQRAKSSEVKPKYKVIFERNLELMKHTNVTLQEYLEIIRDNMLYYEKQRLQNQDEEMIDQSEDEESKFQSADSHHYQSLHLKFDSKQQPNSLNSQDINDQDQTPLQRHRIHQETFNMARDSIFENAITDFYEQTEAIQDEDTFRQEIKNINRISPSKTDRRQELEDKEQICDDPEKEEQKTPRLNKLQKMTMQWIESNIERFNQPALEEVKEERKENDIKPKKIEFQENDFTLRMLKCYEDKNYHRNQEVQQMREFTLKVNTNAATLVVVCIVKMQTILLQYCKRALEMKQKMNSKLVRRIYVTCSKMYVSDMILYNAMLANENDIFYQDASSEAWQLVMKCYEQHEFKHSKRLIRAYNSFHDYLAIGNCVLNKQSKDDNFVTKMLKHSLYSTYFFFNKEKRSEQCEMIKANPDLSMTLELWNMMENKHIAQALEIVLPTVRHNKILYIPMTDIILTKDNIDKLPLYDAFDYQTMVTYQQENQQSKPLFKQPKGGYNPATHVRVRLLADVGLPVNLSTGQLKEQPRPIDHDHQTHNPLLKFLQNISDMLSDQFLTKQSVIIHVHGGGFVAMSSGSHQCYTRMWAKDLKIPIFSIDYRLAPQSQFPDALNDVWQTYYWIVNNCQHYLGFEPDKILLVGDSAGGNLVLATALMAVERKFRVPDGLVLCYPALSITKYKFTPSLLMAIDDPMLPYPFLKMCLESYCGDFSQHLVCDPETNHLISPILASDQLLCKLPTVRIMVAANDPLRDESFNLTYRLARLNHDIKLKEYLYMPHGYLNYNAPLLGMKEESNETINQAKNWLKEMLEKQVEGQHSQ
eukprot:403374374